MELLLTRTTKTEESTIGTMSIDGVQFCFTLEDKDRGLSQTDTLSQIQRVKVHGKTAIPKGRYEVVMNVSARFKLYMPLLLNVPGFEGVRIHWGNKSADTEGCILLGQTKAKDFIGQSKIAYGKFLAKILEVEQTEKVFITIS